MITKSTLTTVFLKAAGLECDDKTVEQYKNTWWWNYRQKDSGGLRLTEAGFDFIIEKTDVRSYKIDLPKDLKITPQIIIYLDRFINCPFYVNKSSITVFSEKAALELYLFSGDIRKMGTVKALNKRFSQDLSS